MVKTNKQRNTPTTTIFTQTNTNHSVYSLLSTARKYSLANEIHLIAMDSNISYKVLEIANILQYFMAR